MKNKDLLFDMTVANLFLSPLSEDDIDYLLAVFRENFSLPDTSIKSIIYDDNPALYDKLIQLNFLS